MFAHYKILPTKILLTIAALSLLAACSSGDDARLALEDVLNKDAVFLSDLDQHDIIYEKTADGSTHTERYCPSGVLKDTSDTVLGTWAVNGNDLVLNSGRTYKTSNAKLEKNMTYNTESTDTYKVIKISKTVCL